MIAFDTLPMTLRIPGVFVEFAPGARGPLDINQKLLLIGQRLSSGTAAAGAPVLITHPDQADEYFGAGSMLARMYRAAYRNNTYTETWGLPLDDDDAGVAASGSITIGGSPTQAGTLSVYIGGHRVRVMVSLGDTPSVVASALAAAIGEDSSLPVTASATDAVVTVTAKNKGAVGNHIDLRHSYYLYESLPQGLTCDITAMSGGSGDPDISDALAGISGLAFDYFCLPYTDTANLTALREDLETRWSWQKQTYGHGFTAAAGTVGELQALGNSHNSQHLTILGAGKSPTCTEEWAAALAAVAAYNLNQDPARPLQTLELKGMLPPSYTDMMDTTERDLLLHDGISTYYVSSDGRCRIEALITTYQENVYGAPDTAYLYVNTPCTLAYLAQSTVAYLSSKFSRHKLARDGGPVPPAGMRIATPSLVRAEVIEHLTRLYHEKGVVEHPDAYQDGIVAEIENDDPSTGQVNLLLPVQLIGQLRRTFIRVEHT